MFTRNDLAAHMKEYFDTVQNDPEYGGDIVDWIWDWLQGQKLTETVLHDLVQDMWRLYMTEPEPTKRAEHAARYIATKELYVSLYGDEIDPDEIDVPDYRYPIVDVVSKQ